MTALDPRADPAAAYRGASTLVTGGLGFIGSNLAIELVRLGARVTIVDSLVPQHGGALHNVAPIDGQARVNVSDLRDTTSLNVLVRDQQFVFHLAGQVSHGDSMRDPHLDLGVNCVSTMNLVEACRQNNPTARLVFASTRQVYGKPQFLPVTEAHPTLPVDVNGINKLAAEYYHLLYDRVYGVRSVVLRLTNTYGPRQALRNDRQGFIGIMLRQALRGETIKVFGTGEQRRDFNHVDDVVRALLLAPLAEPCLGHAFNLGTPRPYSLLEFLDILGRLCPLRRELVPFPDDRRLIDIGDYYGDYSAYAGATGWQPRLDLGEGLERTLAFFRSHAQQYWA